MHNKNRIMAVILLGMFILAALNVFAIPSATQIRVNLISQEPDPANPGDVLDLRFKVENMGSEPTGDIEFEILPDYPLSVYSGDSLKEIGSLQGYQTDDEGIIVLYKLKVDEDAAEGEALIDVRYKAKEVSSSDWVYVKDIPIRVRTRDIVIAIESITSSPDPMPPGQESEVSFKLKNYADSLVRDLKVKLDVSGEDVPFAPVKSTTEKSIYQLGARQETTFVFNLVAVPDADGGLYKIPLTLSYTDETGASYSKEDILSLKVASSPDILATVDSTDIYSKNKAGEVVIKLVNRGLTELKLLTAMLESSDDFEVLSQEEVYIGNIDSDDYETVEFTVNIDSKEDVVTLPLKLSYMDSTNKKFDQTKEVTLRMFSASDAQKAGLVEKQGIGFGIIILIVAGGLGFYWWRKRKKKKSAKKQWVRFHNESRLF